MNTTSVLEQISEGMKTYDRNDAEVGTVKYVQLTDEIPTPPGPETSTPSKVKPLYEETPAQVVAEAIADETGLPKELRQRLMREGFVRVDTGLFRPDRFVLPHQIDCVVNDKLYLKVAEIELITPRQ